MTGPVTAEDVALIDEVEAMLAKAAEGKWNVDDGGICARAAGEGNVVALEPENMMRASLERWPDNAAAIVALHNAAPRLLALARLATRTEPPARGEDGPTRAEFLEMDLEQANALCEQQAERLARMTGHFASIVADPDVCAVAKQIARAALTPPSAATKGEGA